MNSLWIRVDAAIGGKDVVWRLAEHLRNSAGIPAERARDFHAEAVGLLVMFWGGVAQHTEDGVIGDRSDAQLEAWAGWRGEPGCFAAFIREHCVSDDRIKHWDDQQGKLEERRRRDRERKAAAKAPRDSAGIPQERPRNSTSTVRYGTEVTTTPTPSAAQGATGVTGGTESPRPPNRRSRSAASPSPSDEGPRAGRVTWLTPAQGAWERHFGAGSFRAKQAAGLLGPLHQAGLSPEEIARRLDRYCEKRKGGYCKLADFAEHHGEFIPPDVSTLYDNGWMSAELERETRPPAVGARP